VHVVTHLERRCKRCKINVSVRVQDYGEQTDWESLDAQLDKSLYQIIKVGCPNCGVEEWPEFTVMYNISNGKKEQMIKTKIGSEDMPVIGAGDTPYAVAHTLEEEAEYNRGLAKVKECYQEKSEEFWTNYCSFALEKWQSLLKDLADKEFAYAYNQLELPLPSSSSVISVAAWRKDTEKRIKTDEQKLSFWRSANNYIVEEEFVWAPIGQWPMEEWIKIYGRERVTYLTLNIPLPEELEPWRTKALAKVIKKRTGETGVLFERIGQLGRDLDKQRNRSLELSRQLSEARQDNAVLTDQVGKLRQQNVTLRNSPAEVVRDPGDTRKIKSLKGLVVELRDEVERLAGLLPAEVTIPNISDTIEETKEEIQEPTIDLSGKTVLIVGWPKESVEAGCLVLWHDGDGVNVKLQSLTREADIFVVLTRFISHQAMWWLKEEAIEQDKPIIFVRETNIERILEIVKTRAAK